MKRKIMVLVVAWMLLLSFSASADTMFAPYNSYLYNVKKDTVYVPNGYLASTTVNGETLKVGAMSSPEDMMVAGNGKIYVADTGNNRILILKGDLSDAQSLSVFTNESGDSFELNAPLGVFVSSDEKLYICDTGNQRVLVSDLEGRISLIVQKPTSAEFEQSLDFEPRKIAVDKNGNIYVLCNNVYQGVVVFDPSGNFEGYFASNTVQSTLEIVTQKMFKKIMSKEQRNKMAKYVPAEYENLTIQGNFIYTVSYQTNTNAINLNNAIRMLNPAGKNITNNVSSFGDLDTYYDKELKSTVYTKFCDLAVDADSYIYALDSTYGKIFVYDSQFNLLFAFAGMGNQIGTFRYPVAIGKAGKSLLVLDRGKNAITVFHPTAFFEKVQYANQLFNKGLYKEALEPWQEVLTECSNYGLAYTGIGKALFQQGKYAEAMDCFRQVGDQQNYSEAFKYYRLNLIRENFTLLIFGLLGIIVFIALWSCLLRKRVKVGMNTHVISRIPKQARLYMRYPGYCMKHPFAGFEEMKEKGQSSFVISFVIVILWVVSQLLNQQAIAFIFNPNATEKTDINVIFISTIGLYILWVTANLGLRTFMAGRGTLRDICSVSSYCLLPHILATVINIFMSYILTSEEAMILSWITTIGLLWSGIMLLAGMKEIHEYTFGETLKAILLTLLGVVLIIFLFVLFYSSLQQAFSIITTILSELRYRYF